MPDLAERRPGADTLDALDRKLIAVLRMNARLSATAIAREIGLSRTAAQERIARLERRGVILGYAARIAADVEVPALRAVLMVTITLRPCEIVLREIRKVPEVIAGYSVAGPHDAVLIASVADGEALSKLTDRLAAIRGVGKIETAPILSDIRPGIQHGPPQFT